METLDGSQEIVNFFLDKGFLISPNFLSQATKEAIHKKESFTKEMDRFKSGFLVIFDEEIMNDHENKIISNIFEFNRVKSVFEKTNNEDEYANFMKSLKNLVMPDKLVEKKDKINVVFSFREDSKKRTCEDFISYFKSRYNQLQNLLINRQELSNTLSIGKVLSKNEKELVSVIGMVYDKQITKNNNIVLTIEDTTGSIKVLINKNKSELYEEAKDICFDEVIAVQGVNGNKILFANKILWPEIPGNKELKKSPDECYAVFISDTEFGSKFFMEDSFNSFLRWINSEVGNDEQKRISSLVNYLFITGDLVEGVGIYPSQENDLIIPDIYDQYSAFADNLRKIPERIKIIICPGNHDAMRLAEPQPPLYEDFAQSVYSLPNTYMVSNPSCVNIHSGDNFSGFDVLLYHGSSLIHYSENIDSIRSLGGQERVDLTMKYLLRRRHLAPTHQSTLSLPTSDRDNLVIGKVPDFFVTGHIHRASVSNYKNITLINASAWTSITPNQEKRGIKPQPARAMVVNLQTRQVKIMNFNKQS